MLSYDEPHVTQLYPHSKPASRERLRNSPAESPYEVAVSVSTIIITAFREYILDLSTQDLPLNMDFSEKSMNVNLVLRLY